MKISSLAELRALRSRLADMPSVRTAIARRGAEALSKLAREDFDAQRTPSGKPWKPGKGGRALTLRRSGALEAAAVAYRAIGTVIRASVASVRYAKYQLGRGILPRALPEAWRSKLDEIAREELARFMRAA